MIFDKGTRIEKGEFFQQMVLGKLYSHMQIKKKNSNSDFTPYTKLNSE